MLLTNFPIVVLHLLYSGRSSAETGAPAPVNGDVLLRGRGEGGAAGVAQEQEADVVVDVVPSRTNFLSEPGKMSEPGKILGPLHGPADMLGTEDFSSSPNRVERVILPVLVPDEDHFTNKAQRQDQGDEAVGDEVDRGGKEFVVSSSRTRPVKRARAQVEFHGEIRQQHDTSEHQSSDPLSTTSSLLEEIQERRSAANSFQERVIPGGSTTNPVLSSRSGGGGDPLFSSVPSGARRGPLAAPAGAGPGSSPAAAQTTPFIPEDESNPSDGGAGPPATSSLQQASRRIKTARASTRRSRRRGEQLIRLNPDGSAQWPVFESPTALAESAPEWKHYLGLVYGASSVEDPTNYPLDMNYLWILWQRWLDSAAVLRGVNKQVIMWNGGTQLVAIQEANRLQVEMRTRAGLDATSYVLGIR